MEHVLEHADSPRQSLAEIYRVLIPGGVAYIATSNRYHFSPIGYNGEFNVPFYNWFPDALKEAFVHHHLHFKPSLANYTPRPAVHWFCYSDLCRVGRDAGFAGSTAGLTAFSQPMVPSKRASFGGWPCDWCSGIPGFDLWRCCSFETRRS